MAKKIKYRLGTQFWIPLRQGGFARGLVTRMSGKGIIFAYFFGPRVERAHSWSSVSHVSASEAVLQAQVGDLGIINGEWPIDGVMDDWKNLDWPLPDFVRVTSDNLIVVTTYNENLKFKFERSGTAEDLKTLPSDALYGYGAAEIKLSKIL